MENFFNFGSTINNAFFFVVDIIANLQGYFIQQAKYIGKIVLLIAILSAALNYALNGTGLKDNIIKITKATLFFLIVIHAYPSIIGFISSWTFRLAEGSVYSPVRSYFNETIDTVSMGHSIVLHGTPNDEDRSLDRVELLKHIVRDKENLLGGMLTTRTAGRMTYSVVAPASVIKILFFMAGECFNYADGKTQKHQILPEFGRVLKGLICGFFIIFTGAFALLEYVVCFLEFMLVASVGVILFPLSIWEGSKFAAEKFVGAILGFFIKLLLCNVAIFLLIYGFVSLFRIMSDNGFSGAVDQMIFIFFVCLLFFFICKSAPAIAQSLLTGTPSLSATGAISAAAGAVGAAAATVGIAQGAARSGVSSVAKAGAAAHTVSSSGGSLSESALAFAGSIKSDIGNSAKASLLGLTRSFGGGGSGGSGADSWDSFYRSKQSEGNMRGQEFYSSLHGQQPSSGSGSSSPSNGSSSPAQDSKDADEYLKHHSNHTPGSSQYAAEKDALLAQKRKRDAEQKFG